MIDARTLLDEAHAARAHAYAPYSHFLVGAAVATCDGQIFTGCNVENASFGATVCAERVALGAAVASGARRFAAIAIVGARADADARASCFPCGICRQFLAELCDADMPVYVEGKTGVEKYTLSELLPHAFCAEDVK